MKVIGFIVSLFFSLLSYSQHSNVELIQLSQERYKTHIQDSVSTECRYVPIKKNAIYLEYNVLYVYAIYERLFLINNTLQLDAGAGLGGGPSIGGYGKYPLIVFLKPSVLIGGRKHKLEIGSFFTPQRRSRGKFSPNIGCRFVNDNGFTFRIGLVVIMQFEKDFIYPYDEWVDIFPLPGIAFGKSF